MPAVVIHALVAALVVVAITYLALLRFELLDVALETLRYGPEH